MVKKKSICKTCGKVFEYNTGSSNGIYCSQKCYKRNGKNNPRWKKGNNIKGKKNPNYKHGERITPYNIRAWKIVRKKRLKIDNYKCTQCGNNGDVVDHVIPFKIFPTYEIDALQTLCKSCHAKKTWREIKALQCGGDEGG